MEQGLSGAKYFNVNISHLLSQDFDITFKIYCYPAKPRDGAPILLFGENTPSRKIKITLGKRKFGPLYVKEKDYYLYLQFVEDQVRLFIEDDLVPIKKKAEVLYNSAKETIKNIFDHPRSGNNLKRVQSTVNSIVTFSLKNHDAIANLLRLTSYDYYTFTHCVNVAIFGLGFKQTVGYKSEEELREFTLGCICHDIGKTRISERILKKKEKLTNEEFHMIKVHPRHGFVLMKGMIPDCSLDIILHHHEKIDGSGYPDQLMGDDISENTKMAAICDVYDALTTKRCYAEARSPFHGIKLMKDEMPGHFDPDLLERFILFLRGD